MKAWTITWKDTLIRLRDRNALLFFLVAPIVLSAIMGAAFGGSDDGEQGSPIEDIPVIIVNEDDSELGENLAIAFGDVDLLQTTTQLNLEDALDQVEAGEVDAVIHIPAGFGDVVQPTGLETFAAETATLSLFTDPTASVAPLIVRAIVNQITIAFNSGIIGSRLFMTQLTQDVEALMALGASGSSADDIEASIREETASLQGDGVGVQIELNPISSVEDNSDDFNFLTFFAPSMAIFFVLFSVIDGSRSILDEKMAGTLDRLLQAPISSWEIILGKIGGTFLTGTVQLSILILFSLVFFGLRWGDSPLGLLMLIVVTVAAATSLGTLIAGFAQRPSQVGIIGTAVILLFSALGGNFIPISVYPAWMVPLSRFTLNYWAMEGFTDLTIRGLGFGDIVPEISVLLLITAVFFVLGVWRFQQQMAR